MGMAASQARYLALVARKSNCEYEGQQINQARTVLSNQSANLFNQMLGLSVPVPPSTQDYTKQQYSFSDGVNEYTIDSWQQLANDPDYNFVVTQHYYADVYTGSQKHKQDPKVQFSTGTAVTVDQIEMAQRLMTQAKADYEAAKAAVKEKEAEAATLSNYVNTDNYQHITACNYDVNTNSYTVSRSEQEKYGNALVYKDSAGNKYYYNEDDKKYYSTDGTSTPYTGSETLLASMIDAPNAIYKGYSQYDENTQKKIADALDILIEKGALSEDTKLDYADVYYNEADGSIAFKSDLKSLYGGNVNGSKTILPVYYTGDAGTDGTIENKAAKYDAELATLQAAEFTALQTYEAAETTYNNLQRPTYVGNSELTLLVDLTDDQKAELRQVVSDMRAQGINAAISDCFDNDGNYLGGVYSFQLNGVTYYTTYADLNKSYQSGTGINNIDGQDKLAYYNATYVSTKMEETKKALLETDGNGRFTSVRFEDDSIKYTLNMETVTDDNAYQDAMNQYYYESAQYDKMVQDINAKTSLIQQEDLQLELRLKQLDTEQNALSTEIDAVSKVVKDNIEDSFKTFGG